MLSRSRIRSASKIMLFALMFAQAAIASAICDMPDWAPAQAIAQGAVLPCHEEPVQNSNLCLAHCLSADQSADTPQVVVPAWSVAAPLTVSVVVRCRGEFVALRHMLPHPGAPPPRILFQSFLI